MDAEITSVAKTVVSEVVNGAANELTTKFEKVEPSSGCTQGRSLLCILFDPREYIFIKKQSHIPAVSECEELFISNGYV